MNKPTSDMAKFLYAVNEAALYAVNWYSTRYHMSGTEKPEIITDLKVELNKAIKSGNDKAFRTQYANLIELINYTDRWGEESANRRLLKMKQTVEEKRKDIVDNRVSLTNFDQVAEIIRICSDNNFDDSISGANLGNIYHVTVEKVDNAISITITSDSEKGLRINYGTSSDSSNRFYAANLQLHYYSSDNSISFKAKINVLNKELLEENITTILSELIAPYTDDGKEISWDDIPKCMFEQSELQYIISMLNDTIGTKDALAPAQKATTYVK